MIDNAVAHYRYLREQGVLPSSAVQGVVQRYGVSAEVVRERVNGKVADHDATVEALAEARAVLVAGGPAEPFGYGGGEAVLALLRNLYNAVTGEGI